MTLVYFHSGKGFKSEAAVSQLPEDMQATVHKLPARKAVASAGDVVEGGERYLFHRASAVGGLSGSPLRVVDRPQLLVGIHLGLNESGPLTAFNVGVRVNHPLFVVAYVRSVLPRLVKAQDDHWRRPYMKPALAAYLAHHQRLLVEHDLWEPLAAEVASRWSE
ncbi:hypothetical protein WJX73_006987 [Symbiochloris irregularis]|uniref:Serine protease n=1 Tax=Symbiochloris irregularis TaxID=706552 RepID=A0AAW1P144_9CHLO